MPTQSFKPPPGPPSAARFRPGHALIGALIGGLAAVSAAVADGVPGSDPAASFPGAAGFGAVTPGGRGGPVIMVDSLADSGPGTLRDALERPGPRIVAFAVDGEIALRRPIVAEGRLTVLGQVAPGAGVTVTGARIQIAGDDVIVRGMRFRPGDGPGQDPASRDGLTVGGRGAVVRRVVIDGNSLTWATDENASIWGDVADVTFSRNIVAEGLMTGHPEPGHSMGLLVSNGARRVSVHGNLFHSNRFRNPQVGRADMVEIVNNLVTNPGLGGISINTAPTRVDVVANVLEAGPSTHQPRRRALIALQADEPGFEVFVSGNLTPLGRDVVRGPGADRRARARTVTGSGLSVAPATTVRARVLSTAGARWPRPHPADARILAEAAAARGRPPDRVPDDAPPKAAAPASGVRADRDRDGVPDDAERRLGSDPDTPDSHRIAPGTPYAFIEVYAESLRER